MSKLPEHLENKFNEHQIEVLVNTPDVQVFRCQKPGTWMYGFQVVCSDNMISMMGDIGSLMITPGYGRRGLGWLRGSINSSLSYILEKVPREFETTEFDRDQAKKDLKEYVDNEDWLEEKNRLKLACILEDFYETGDYGMYKLYEEIYEIFQGEIPNLRTPTTQVIFQINALKWMCNQLDKMNFEIATNEIPKPVPVVTEGTSYPPADPDWD